MLVGSCVGFLLIASISHDGLRALNQYEQQPVRERNKQQRRMNQNQQPIKESENQDEDEEADTEESKEQPTSEDEETQTKKVRRAIFHSCFAQFGNLPLLVAEKHEALSLCFIVHLLAVERQDQEQEQIQVQGVPFFFSPALIVCSHLVQFVLRDANSGLLRLVRAGNDVLIQFGLEAPTGVAFALEFLHDNCLSSHGLLA